jgi:recombinational DNA repair ATPase RecF
MYIKELRIEEFGALRAATVPLSNGINLLIGNNETGKSTLCAFIKFIFYGFADSKERELHASLRTGNSAGALVVSKDGVLYRIERRDAGRVRNVSVYDEETGRKMDCYTTLPGIQLYTACALDTFEGKRHYERYCALCLETQGYPNSPNCPQYPSTELKAGETYHEITIYRFSVKK